MRFYVGLDLGQRRDHSALAVVESVEQWRPYGAPDVSAVLVRHLERLPLGLQYAQVVERTREVMECRELAGQCELVVDATGVGRPVVEMLRAEGLARYLTAVTITGGAKESGSGPELNVPKQDLMAALQLLLEKGIVRIARDLPAAGALVEELADMRRTFRASGSERLGADGSGEHDDLAIAVALACWKLRRPVKMNSFGQHPLIPF
jgi:hypothetical protein